jgi:copper transporter 1
MLFTWSTDNLCIVFRGWHIRNNFTLILSLLAIVALCAGYEAVREVSRRYEASESAKIANIPSEWYPCCSPAKMLVVAGNLYTHLSEK